LVNEASLSSAFCTKKDLREPKLSIVNIADHLFAQYVNFAIKNGAKYGGFEQERLSA
tara:strand:+ start:471 stop:641 length:171 start_codon:yes stop_codon:yes gene_type:complete